MLCRVWQCWSVRWSLGFALVGAWAGCVGLGWSVGCALVGAWAGCVGLGHTLYVYALVCEPVREVDTKVSLCQAAKPVHVTPEYLFKNTLVAPNHRHQILYLSKKLAFLRFPGGMCPRL